MDSNHKEYNYLSSFARLDGILAQSDSNYEEVDKLPDRDRLTYTNGFYANCSALFVDIRDSSKLPDKYKRPRLAKLYRAFISELVAIMNGNERAREVNIVGDCVWAVFNTVTKKHVNEVFSTAARINALVNVLNYKLKKVGYGTPIKVGIGMAYGRALMIKAGYNGSGLSDVVYMGDVVNHAAKLAAQGGKGKGTPTMMIGNSFASCLDEHRNKLVTKNSGRNCYTANAVRTEMNDWYKKELQLVAHRLRSPCSGIPLGQSFALGYTHSRVLNAVPRTTHYLSHRLPAIRRHGIKFVTCGRSGAERKSHSGIQHRHRYVAE